MECAPARVLWNEGRNEVGREEAMKGGARAARKFGREEARKGGTREARKLGRKAARKKSKTRITAASNPQSRKTQRRERPHFSCLREPSALVPRSHSARAVYLGRG